MQLIDPIAGEDRVETMNRNMRVTSRPALVSSSHIGWGLENICSASRIIYNYGYSIHINHLAHLTTSIALFNYEKVSYCDKLLCDITLLSKCPKTPRSVSVEYVCAQAKIASRLAFLR